MINYLSTFVNTDGNSYPDTAAVNSSGPGTTDGTEFVKAMIDDAWGFNQALLNYTDDTPNGSSEADGASQRLDSILKIVANITTISTTSSHTVEEWNKHGIIVATGSGITITLSAGTGADQSNRVLVYNQSGGLVSVNNGSTTDVIQDNELIEYIYDGTSAFDRIVQDPKSLDVIVKDADYTILDSDPEDIFIGDPNSSTQKGLLTITAPATGSNTSKLRRIEHGTTRGLMRANANGSQRFNFKGKSLQYILLYMPGDYVEFYWNTNTSKWSIHDYKISMPVNFQNQSDYTLVKLGNGVTYDNKSAAIDFTGMVITEATSNFTAIVVEDTGGTGTSGILYVYDLSSAFTFWTNNRVLTASDGTTADVNEVSGTSKNVNYGLHNGFGVDITDYKLRVFISTDGSANNSFEIFQSHDNSADNYGFTNFQISTSASDIWTGTGGISYVNTSGSVAKIQAQDWYINKILEF
jgi:hypothetical protein